MLEIDSIKEFYKLVGCEVEYLGEKYKIRAFYLEYTEGYSDNSVDQYYYRLTIQLLTNSNHDVTRYIGKQTEMISSKQIMKFLVEATMIKK